MERAKNKNLIGLFILGAVMLFLPVLSEAAPPSDPVGTHIFCGGAVTIGANLGRAQPLRPHGTCRENLSISDTRVNITILGDGGDTLKFGSACLDPNNTKIIGADPTAGAVIDIRGKNILITGVEISGVSVLDPTIRPKPIDPAFYNPATVPTIPPTVASLDLCKNTVKSGIGDDANCNNSRGVRIQRGATVQLGRNVADTDEPKPLVTQWDEQTGICVHHVAKRGVEATQQAFLRITNSEIHDTGGDAISISEGSAADIGFASGGDFTNFFTSSFPGPGRSGPNFIHNGAGAGVNVQSGSQARIFGNTISVNKKDGIALSGRSNADIGDNLIHSNTLFAISLADNSNVNLGTTTDVNCDPITSGHLCAAASHGTIDISKLANSVAVKTNTAGGIKCSKGGGTLSGKSSLGRDAAAGTSINSNLGGAGNSIDATCISSLN